MALACEHEGCDLESVVTCDFDGKPTCDKHSVHGKYCSEACYRDALASKGKKADESVVKKPMHPIKLFFYLVFVALGLVFVGGFLGVYEIRYEAIPFVADLLDLLP